ncbi:hypothetical protein LTR62_008878 [Meristemomyces frigidus]|uniref:Mitochondrial ribosomal protein MRP51 n=1 Tax=Meristemomyces frigidus TaxID=1508187 RepID=A0AAN7TA71_9PEZI|nr:hypothetical protein LTR62_008878 [Meristemomyces frigidus]
MSKAATSPTARLLQNSRLFSLPRPLPQPGLDAPTATGLYRGSDTATTPYPTYQAIATPPSSRFRGDWGLKRALPAKATSSSTPHIRVRAHDNTEHITDFGSAADHTQTSAKWQELGVPLLMRQARGGRDNPRVPISVFEEGLDQTDGGVERTWKWNGPWLAGMKEGEFNLFIKKLVARRGASGQKDINGKSSIDEFREFVRERIVDEEIAQARRQAQDQGDILSPQRIAEMRVSLRLDDQQLSAHLLSIRTDHAKDNLSSQLTAHLTAFLDLPPVTSGATSNGPTPYAVTKGLQSLLTGVTGGNDLVDTSPPTTHPSAGLSYLRSAAIMPNHPLHGPQSHRAPVRARVLRTRTSATGSEQFAKVGVAGVVALDSASSTFNPDNRIPTSASDLRLGEPNRMASQLDVELKGGNKLWVHPNTAYIDEKGRIRLDVSRGTAEAVAVREGDVDFIHEQRAQSFTGGMAPFGVGTASRAPPGTAGNANYGVGLPDRRRPAFGQAQAQRAPESAVWGQGGQSGRRQPDYSSAAGMGRKREEVRGFDEVLGGKGEGMDEENAMRRIRELADGR